MAELAPQELEEIRARHKYGTQGIWTHGGVALVATCEGCVDACPDHSPPCDAVRLLARIEEMEKVVAAAREAKQAVLKWANTCHHTGCECDNVLADELPDDWMAVLEARAALGGEDG